MAKVKEESPLDTALLTREQIMKQREKGQHARRVMEERVEELRAIFATMSPTEREEYRTLRQSIPVELEIDADLAEKEQEQEGIIQRLTQEQDRVEAGHVCVDLEHQFMGTVAFMDPAPLEALVSQATGALDLYYKAYGTKNFKIEQIRTRLTDLIFRMKDIQKPL